MVELAGVARFVLPLAALAVLVFTVGALAGWRWGARRGEHEPTWIFVAGQAGWGLLSLLLSPHPEGFGWLTWATVAAVVTWLVALALQLRARAGRSGHREAS